MPPREARDSSRSAKKPTRRPLPGFGVRGQLGTKGTLRRPSTLVRVVLEDGYVRVLWSEGRVRRQESRDDTAQNREWARAFGEVVHEELRTRADGGVVAPTFEALTLRDVWTRYLDAHQELRPQTVKNYRERWLKAERFLGRSQLARQVTREHLDQFVKALRKLHEPAQVREIVKTAVRVFRWAVDRDLVPATKVTAYRVKLARGERARRIPEYTLAEARAILGQFDPRDARAWRPYVASYLFALTGARQNAGRHWTWDDVRVGTITWTPDDHGRLQPTYRGFEVFYRADLDKMGEERWQPLPSGAVEALLVALGWREAMGYAGPYILFRPAKGTREFDADAQRWRRSARAERRAAAAEDQPYSYAAYNRQLHAAEAAAKVTREPYRAAHSFRRHVLNNALEATGGNLALAAQFIGDRDLATVARSYARVRDEQLRTVAESMADPLATPLAPSTAATPTTTEDR